MKNLQALETAKRLFTKGLSVKSASKKINKPFTILGKPKFGENNINDIYCETTDNLKILVFDSHTGNFAEIC